MRVIISGATLLAWVSAVMAQTAGFDAVLTPAKDEVVTAGSTYTITWDYSSTYAGTVSIQLLEGTTSTTLQLGDVIASGIDNSLGQYSWTVDSSLGDDATYGLKIIYGSSSDVFQYSNPFQISKAASASSSSSVAAASSSSVAAPVTTAAATSTSVPVAAHVADASSTVYSTEWLTVTSCAATVTDCPARSTVTSSTLRPLVTTVKPSAASSSAEASPSGPVVSSVYASASASSSAAALASSSTLETASTVQSTVSTGPSSAVNVAFPQTTLTPSYPTGNSTGSGSGALGTVTLSSSTASSTGPSSSVIAASGAGKVAAGSVALFAGLVAAVFAL